MNERTELIVGRIRTKLKLQGIKDTDIQYTEILDEVNEAIKDIIAEVRPILEMKIYLSAGEDKYKLKENVSRVQKIIAPISWRQSEIPIESVSLWNQIVKRNNLAAMDDYKACIVDGVLNIHPKPTIDNEEIILLYKTDGVTESVLDDAEIALHSKFDKAIENYVLFQFTGKESYLALFNNSVMRYKETAHDKGQKRVVGGNW